MVRLSSVCALLIGLAAHAPPVLAEERRAKFTAQTYRAVSEWTLSHDSYSCKMSRHFERNGERLTLTMRSIHPGAELQFGIYGAQVRRGREPVIVGFFPSEAYSSHDELASASLGDTTGYAFPGHPYPEVAQAILGGEAMENVRSRFLRLAENTTHFFVKGLTKDPVALTTGAMTATFEQLDQCLVERLAEMGITEELQRSTASFPEPLDADSWRRKIAQVYPKDALRKGFDGLVEMRIVVGAEGIPDYRHVSNQLIARPLREAACNAMMEHSRFRPARNTEGEAIVGLFFQSVYYKNPALSRFEAD